MASLRCCCIEIGIFYLYNLEKQVYYPHPSVRRGKERELCRFTRVFCVWEVELKKELNKRNYRTGGMEVLEEGGEGAVSL